MSYDDWYVIDPITGCWIWKRALNRSGYASMNLNGKTRRAHIVLYERKFGPVPKGMELDHAVCQEKRCVNPEHLEPVTHVENVRRHHSRFGEMAPRIREMYALGGISQQKIAEEFGIDQTTVSLIVLGKRWAHV